MKGVGRPTKKLSVDHQNEIALLKTILMLCSAFGAKYDLRDLHHRGEFRLMIDLPETALNIWTNDSEIVEALRAQIDEK